MMDDDLLKPMDADIRSLHTSIRHKPTLCKPRRRPKRQQGDANLNQESLLHWHELVPALVVGGVPAWSSKDKDAPSSSDTAARPAPLVQGSD